MMINCSGVVFLFASWVDMDVLFIAPGNSRGIYQDLAEDYAAIEPPTWALLLAQSCRAVGLEVGICDANAERLDGAAVFERVQQARALSQRTRANHRTQQE